MAGAARRRASRSRAAPAPTPAARARTRRASTLAAGGGAPRASTRPPPRSAARPGRCSRTRRPRLLSNLLGVEVVDPVAQLVGHDLSEVLAGLDRAQLEAEALDLLVARERYE